MQPNQLLIDGFDRVRGVVRAAVEGLGEDELAWRPGEDANSIAWLAWHLTRGQDDHVSELAGEEQAWASDGWFEKFGLPFDEGDIGYGQTSDEVEQVRASAELLVGYHEAVYERTVAYLKTLKDEDYGKVIDDNWEPPVTLGVRLVSVMDDDMQHAGQAAYVRGLLG
jgi:uncharacterized damage-inducible protein DinB